MRKPANVRDPFADFRRTQKRTTSRTASSALVLAALLAMPMKETLAANGFQGTITSSTGSIVDNSSGLGFITVNSPTAVINWQTTGTPNGGTVVFFGEGDTMRFQSSTGNYTVLNRVLPADGTSKIAINGPLRSYADLSQGQIGGNVWFYSPKGIIIGSTAQINVGGLLLTTLDPVLNAGALDSATTFSLGGATDPSSSIVIQAGASIRAQQTGSYVAMIAPQVQQLSVYNNQSQAGGVLVNGTAAYIGAEQVDVTISQGLFDISFQQGTTNTSPIIHSGTTTGTASSGSGDYRRIYLAAMPKNNAITMLLSGGALGFDVAGAADVVGNAVILSTGKDIANPLVTATGVANVAGRADSNIEITGGTFTSKLRLFSSGTSAIAPATALTLPSLDIVSDGNVLLSALNGALDVDGSVDINTGRGVPQNINVTTGSVTLESGTQSIAIGTTLDILTGATAQSNSGPGAVTIRSGDVTFDTQTGGSITVSGATEINPSALADSSSMAASARGGNVLFRGGGSINLSQGLTILSAAASNYGSAGVIAGSATSGDINLGNSDPLSLTIGGAGLAIYASAYGAGTTGSANAGGTAQTGSIRLLAGGDVNLASFYVESEARGGNSDAAGGSATIGEIRIGAISGNPTTITDSIGMDLIANGGNGVSGGAAIAEDVRIYNVGGSSFNVGGIDVDLDLRGGLGGTAGGSVTSGFVSIENSSGAFNINGNANLITLLEAGAASNGVAGVVTGGTTQIFSGAPGQTLTIAGDVSLEQNAQAYPETISASGAELRPGIVQIVSNSTSGIDIGGRTELISHADGFQTDYGTGGNARGGIINVIANNGTIKFGTDDEVSDRSVTLRARGTGGFSTQDGTAGNGTGGEILALAENGGQISIFDTITLDAPGLGGEVVSDPNGNGGVGKGGIAVIRAFSAGTVAIASGADVLATGEGGAGGVQGVGGEGRGGTAAVNVEGGRVLINATIADGGIDDDMTIGFLNLDASGIGGSGLSGGAGFGGALTASNPVYEGGAFLNARSGDFFLYDGTDGALGEDLGLLLRADGKGADGGVNSGPGGDGGVGRGGHAEVLAFSGASDSTIRIGAARLSVVGEGGTGGEGTDGGGRGGIGLGGGAKDVSDPVDDTTVRGAGLYAQAGNGHLNVFGPVELIADGYGGSGGDPLFDGNGAAGGVGRGGAITAGVISGLSSASTTGSANFYDTVTLTANGAGGSGGSGGDTGAGGAGGAGYGGSAAFLNRGGTINAAILQQEQFPSGLDIRVFGEGGHGGYSADQAGGAGGNGEGGAWAVLSTRRFEFTTDGGLMYIGDIYSDAGGAGGNGGGSGVQQSGADGAGLGGTFEVAANFADLRAGSLYIISEGGATASGELVAIGKTLKFAGDASPDVSGALGLFTDQGGVIEADTFSVSATSVVDSISNRTVTAPGTVRTLQSAPYFTSLQSFDNSSTFEALGFQLNAPTVRIGGIKTSGSSTSVLLQGTNGLTVDRDIVTAGFASISSSGGSLMLGSVTAGDGISIFTGTGSATMGALNSANNITVSVGGDLTIGGALSGRDTQLPPPQFSYPKTINLSAGGSITATGLLSAADYILLGAEGGIAVADIDTENSVGLFAGTSVSTGAVTARGAGGGLYIGNYSQFSQASGSGPGFMFGVVPVRVGGTVTTGSISAEKIVIAGEGGVTVGNIAPQAFILDSGGALTTGSITVASDLFLTSDGDITTGQIVSLGFVSVAGGGAVGVGNVNAASAIEVFGAGGVTTGTLTSGSYATVASGGNATVGGANVAGDLEIEANGAVSAGSLAAGTTINILGGGDVTVASASTSSSVPRAPSSSPTSSGVSMQSGGLLSVGNVTTTGDIGLLSAGSVAATSLSGEGSIFILAAQNVSVGSATTGGAGQVYIANSSMFPIVDQAQDPAVLFATAPVGIGGNLSLGQVNTGVLTAAGVGTLTATGAITTGGDTRLTFGAGANVGAITAGQRILLNGASVTSGQLTAGAQVLVNAFGGSANIAGATAGITSPSSSFGSNDISITAVDSVSTGALNAAGTVNLLGRNGSVSAGTINGASAVLLARTDVTAAAVTTPGLFYIGNSSLAGTQIQPLASVPVGGAVRLNGSVNAGGVNVAGASINGGAVTATNIARFFSPGAITLGDVSAGGQINLDGFAGVTAGALVSGHSVDASSDGGSVTVASASAGLVNRSTAPNATYTVGLGSLTGVTVGTVDALGDVGMKADNGSITAGAVTSQGNVAILASNDTTLASISTGSNGTVYLANASMSSLADADDGFNLAPLLAAAPVRSGGTLTITGPVSTGLLNVASGGFTSQGAITGGTVRIDSGTAAFNGAVTATNIAVTSGDIAIGANGALGGAGTTALALTSTGASTTIGGAGTGTGYQLDATEVTRLRAAQITLAAASDIAMQNLTLNAASQLGATGSFRVQTPQSIRITGNVDFTNVASGNAANFTAGGSFTIVTDTGRLRMADANNAVAGTANITATDVAVVTSAVAAQLAVNPKFAGRDALLGAPRTGDAVNPDGYLQAGRLGFTASNTLLIQNTGSLSAPAGFTSGTGGVTIASATQGTATPLDVVIFGRGLDATGTALPPDGITAAVTIAPSTTLSTTSSANGCVFGATRCAAGVVQTVAQTQVSRLTATIQAAVTGGLTNPGTPSTTTSGTTSSTDTGNQSASAGSDDGEEGGDDATPTASTSPVGPNVLIDTGNLGANVAQPDALITSSGNSSLWSGADGIGGDSFGGGDVGGSSSVGGGAGGSGGGTTGGGGAGAGSGGGAGAAGGSGGAGGAAGAGGTGGSGADAAASGTTEAGSGNDGGEGGGSGGDAPSAAGTAGQQPNGASTTSDEPKGDDK